YHKALWFRRNNNEQIAHALALTGMEKHAEQDFRALSGGQQQRVRLARALVAQPRILLLDEPAAALDSRAQASLYELLRKLCDDTGMAVVMVEHDIAAISDFVNSVACLNRKIHHHAMRGETIPEQIWRDMYGEHMHIVAHDAHCIGCAPDHVAEDHHKAAQNEGEA
ncbi:MAG: ATP-binding cassette domain-containing protein, partial [Mariprofundaceae bacterium]|nr:ATP-binding cassette domain-containing protein [Mariprofundaceae bacterium]